MNRRTFRTETPLRALIVEQALLLAKQLETTTDAAPDGQVLSLAWVVRLCSLAS